MKSFLSQFGWQVFGVLRGFDRIRFRGTFCQLATASGMIAMLRYCKVLFKDFGQFAERTTKSFRNSVESMAAAAAVPVQYLSRSETDKEQLVNRVAKQRTSGPGLVAVHSAVESATHSRSIATGNRRFSNCARRAASVCTITHTSTTRRSDGRTRGCRRGFRGTSTS